MNLFLRATGNESRIPPLPTPKEWVGEKFGRTVEPDKGNQMSGGCVDTEFPSSPRE